MTDSLNKNERVVVVTMDLRRFYHNVNPRFIQREEFLTANSIHLSSQDRALTELLLRAVDAWYASTPDHKERPEGAIPVGLSASKVIANVLLADFDRQIVKHVRPIYYGRYVDDIILAVKLKRAPLDGEAVMQKLAADLPEMLTFRRRVPDSSNFGLKVSLPYAKDSELFFTGAKQKVFNLSGESGQDLITQIREQIRKQSSEHRLLPLVPDTSEGMASKSLLAQPSASLEADAIRKADVVAIRRQGLALLLRDVESYARDLPPTAWTKRREDFYGVVCRHLVTPRGFFDYFPYLYRVFSLMVASGDFSHAKEFVSQFVEVAALIHKTTTAGTRECAAKFRSAKAYYAAGFLQAAAQASTVVGFSARRYGELLVLLRSLRALDPELAVPSRTSVLRSLSGRLLHMDWGRRPYRAYWLANSKRRIPNPLSPDFRSIMLRLAGVRHFRRAARLQKPYWPGVVFPTRPLSLSEIASAAPELLRNPRQIRSALFAFRGTKVSRDETVEVRNDPNIEGATEIVVPFKSARRAVIAIPSVYTRTADWKAAIRGRPNLDVKRYESLRDLVSRIMQARPRPNYVLFPECSIPAPWAMSFAHGLAKSKISLVAGLECRPTPQGVRNDALISLATKWPHYWTALQFIQPKTAPAHPERAYLSKRALKLYTPRGRERSLPVYVHGSYVFGVLVCSDLTDISCRQRFRGAVDTLVVLEWNRDLTTFVPLVEASAIDLHTYIAQVNNRKYGDSRIRAPREESYERDVMILKGGEADFFAIGAVDFRALRDFQRSRGLLENGFKPLPIGFRLSDRRK